MTNKGVKVTGFIMPVSLNDTYPTHIDVWGKGGVHSVETIADRDAIAFERRKFGMMAYVVQVGKLYVLVNGLDNLGWVEFFDFSSGVPTRTEMLTAGYIYLGNEDNLAEPSLFLRDLEIDVVALRRRIDELEPVRLLKHNFVWLGNEYNKPQEVEHIPLSVLPELSAAKFPLPEGLNNDFFYIPNPEYYPLSPSDLIMSSPWLPETYANRAKLNPTDTEVVNSSALAMTMVQVFQALRRVSETSFIVKSRNISWSWNNALTYALPEVFKQFYNLSDHYTHLNSQALDELGAGIVKNSANGVLEIANHGRQLNFDYIAPAELVEAEGEIYEHIAEALAGVEAEIGALQGEVVAIQTELFFGGAGIAATVLVLQGEIKNLNTASIYTSGHLTGSGRITVDGAIPNYIDLFLRSEVPVSESYQAFHFHNIDSVESSFIISFDSNKVVQAKPLNYSLISTVTIPDLAQPEGIYKVYKGFKIQAQFDVDGTDTSEPIGLYIKHLEYEDDKTYFSEEVKEHTLLAFDVKKEVVDLYVTLYLGNWTETTKPQDPERGYFGFNTDKDTIEWYESTGWKTPNSGAGSGSVTAVGIKSDSSGLQVISGSPVTSSGVIELKLDDKLQNIVDFTKSGFLYFDGQVVGSIELIAGAGIILDKDTETGNITIYSTGGGGGGGDVTQITGAVTGVLDMSLAQNELKLNSTVQLVSSDQSLFFDFTKTSGRASSFNIINDYKSKDYGVGAVGVQIVRLGAYGNGSGTNYDYAGYDLYQTFDCSVAGAPKTQEVKLRFRDASFNTVDALKHSASENLFSFLSHIAIPVGTTAQRLPTAKAGNLRFNSDIKLVECFDGSSWQSFNDGLTSVGVITNGNGLEIDDSPLTKDGSIKINLTPKLEEIVSNPNKGILTQLGSGNIVAREVINGGGIGVENGDGDDGNIILSLALEITGAVLSNTMIGNTLSVSLNENQNLNNLINWSFGGSSADINHYIEPFDSTDVIRQNFVSKVDETNFSKWQQIFKLSASGAGRYELKYIRSSGTPPGFVVEEIATPLVVDIDAGKTYIDSIVDVKNHQVKNVNDPTDLKDAVNLQTLYTVKNLAFEVYQFALTLAGQTTNLSAGDHIKFYLTQYPTGSYTPNLIALDNQTAYSNLDDTPSIGRVTLKKGYVYEVSLDVGTASFSVPTTGLVEFYIYIVTGNDGSLSGHRTVGHSCIIVANDGASHLYQTGRQHATTFIDCRTCANNVMIEARIYRATALSGLQVSSNTYAYFTLTVKALG